MMYASYWVPILMYTSFRGTCRQNIDFEKGNLEL